MDHSSSGSPRRDSGMAAVDRREFLMGATSAVAGVMLTQNRALAVSPADAASFVAGKDPRLVVHTAKPAVFETPAELLSADQVTPVKLLFVRNHQQPAEAATIKPVALSGWKIELASLISRPQTIDATALAELEQVEREMVLQCSGNGRALYAKSVAVKGSQWGRGGMGNVRFGGVPLATVLDHFGIQVKPEAKYLTAEGKDEPAAGEHDFEHSIPIEEALKKSLLALRLNGEPIPAIHGGPVRLVTPGYYGTMHIKWLSRLRFESRESDHTSQIPNYRTPRTPIAPGTPFTATYDNSEPNWRMRMKSVVLSPAPGSKLAAGEVSVSGVAFNDGEARIETVLVSPDAGRTWQRAVLEAPESPWAWYRWHARLNLARGPQQIWATAIDGMGRSQPPDGSVDWNPSGYLWSGVEKIDVKVG